MEVNPAKSVLRGFPSYRATYRAGEAKRGKLGEGQQVLEVSRFPRPPIGGIASEVLALRGISPDLISRLYGEGKDVSIIVQGTLCAE